MNRGGRARGRSSGINMAMDSRELRFYASASSSRPSAGSKQQLNTDIFNPLTTPLLSYVDEKIPAGGNRKLLEVGNPASFSIYSNGIGGLMNTFDSERKLSYAYAGAAGTARYSSFVSFTSHFLNITNDSVGSESSTDMSSRPSPPGQDANTIPIDLTEQEQELFDLLRTVTKECGMKSTLRVAGGWVRDKILATKEFKQNRLSLDLLSDGDSGPNGEHEAMNRITSKFKGEKGGKFFVAVNHYFCSFYDDAFLSYLLNIISASTNSASKSSDNSLSVTVPVDIDIALDDKLGREFADELNQWLSDHGRETHSVGVVLKNPEKSKHLETATMRVNNYWIDFVNLRAEEYTSDSRIPDLMRIGTPEEDAFRRDLTINSLFYNINEGIVEDMTGRGLDDLRSGIVATPLPPLTTLLDDPLRVLRSVRFAARLRFTMSEELRAAAADERVKAALDQKVSRERVGSEVDLMLKSRDPVGAMRLLVNLGLIETVFPHVKEGTANGSGFCDDVFDQGLTLLSTTHGHLCDCKANPPMWCEAKRALEAGVVNGVGKEETRVLMEDEDARRLLWYAAFLKPLRGRTISCDEDAAETRKKPRKAKRSVILRLLVDELKRPIRDADQVEKIMIAADNFTKLVSIGSDVSALSVLLSRAQVKHDSEDRNKIVCTMNKKIVDPNIEDDPVWQHCMEFRKNCAVALRKIGPLWRAAFILSLCEQLMDAANDELEYMIEGDIVSSTFRLLVSCMMFVRATISFNHFAFLLTG
jgi:tRNA nucleotidyltransferase (CCA-adding enzyme)